METGIDAIDRLQRTQSFNVYDHAILDANGGYITDAEGKFILTAASYDEYQEQYEDNVDNKRIEDESNRDAVDANDSSPDESIEPTNLVAVTRTRPASARGKTTLQAEPGKPVAAGISGLPFRNDPTPRPRRSGPRAGTG